MKRKLLIIFLTVISAVCICVGVSACDVLSSYISSSTDTSSSYSSTNNGSNSSSQSTEQTSSGSDSTGETAGDSTSDSTEQNSSGNDNTDQSSDDSTGQTSPDSDSTGSESTGTKKDDDETEADFAVRAGNSSYGYCQLANETNGAAMQSIYYQMYEVCEEFTASTEDVTPTVTTNSTRYTLAEISYSGSLTTDEAKSVWKVFYLENPMYYWLSSSCVYSNDSSILYLCIDEAYANYSVRATYDAAISAMVTEASAQAAKQSTELGKAMAIHDYIIGVIDYAYQSDGTTPETAIWAHNITGVSSKGYGVCEAYAKTYLALCLINGLDCVIVSGYAKSSGEDHAWNIVEIDGVWYGVDCTWDDTATSELSYVYFGMNADTLNDNHTALTSDIYGMQYLYDLPEVTDCGIQPVTLFKGETSLGMYANIDAAFAAMKDSAADYTICFYFDNPAGTTVYTSPATTMYIYSASTPAVNSITISGVYTAIDGGYFYVSYLNIDSTFTLNCDLEISDMIFTAADLDLGEYTLTTGGYYCRLNGNIHDSKTSSTISIKSATTLQTAIYAAINVSYYYGQAQIYGTATIGTYYGSNSLSVYGTATIGTYISANETNYYNIYMQESAALTVNNLVYDSGSTMTIYVLFQFDSIDNYPSLYLGNVTAQTYLYIDGTITSATTDADGNTVDAVEATPDNLNCAIATLGNAGDFTNIMVYFDSTNKTTLYTVNAENQIVYNTAG